MTPVPSARPTPWRRSERGFTLIELLVVLVILGLLATIAGPRVIKFIGGAKTDTAQVQIQQLAGALELYRLEVGRYPSPDEGLGALVARPGSATAWNGPYIRNAEAIVDPWGNPYVYRVPGSATDFDIYSLGADGREGGDGEDQDVALNKT